MRLLRMVMKMIANVVVDDVVVVDVVVVDVAVNVVVNMAVGSHFEGVSTGIKLLR